MAAMEQTGTSQTQPSPSRWVTGVGAGLTAAGIGFGLIAPADFLGWVVLAGAITLTIGIGARV